MQKDLDFITTGSVFPPFDERERLNKYRDSKLLFDGKHDWVFHRWAQTSGYESLNVIVNWHRRLSVMWADMLFGQRPEIKAENQERLEEVIQSTDFINRLYESAIDVSRFGTGIFKVRMDGEIIVDVIPPDIWFPVVDARNVKDVKQHVLAWKYTDSSDNAFLAVEIHTKQDVTYQTYSLARDDGISRLLEEEVEVHNLGKFLVRPVNNVTTSDSLLGVNDYDDINPILEEIEMRLTQISRVLDKHADPSMYGDETALEFNERTGEYVVRGGGSFYPVSDENVKPGYITWDANLSDAQEQINTLMKQFYVITNTSSAAFGQLEQGLAESGSAMKRLLMATLIKANRMKTQYTTAIIDVLNIASELSNRNGKGGFGAITVEFRDSLPEDTTEMTNNEVQRYTTGLTSLESAIGRLDGISGEALESEINRIQDQESKNDGRNENV